MCVNLYCGKQWWKQKSLIRPELIKWFKLTAPTVCIVFVIMSVESTKGCPQFTLYIKALLILITFQLNLN